ncbi:hypothetical protein [Ancylobacter sp. 3268]|uniref:hypothetical protein n=1 Tax=Ancylobacter sp. 3268 TaxID=2817752 RepID=UPI00286CCB50|nr:hypothetical protein [Ancylobacter sp. 3268]
MTIVPAGAVRVDRGSPWRPPFWTDHPYVVRQIVQDIRVIDCPGNRMLFLARMFRDWICGTLGDHVMWRSLPHYDRALPAPPTLTEIRTRLGGRILADWPRIGQPCIGDVFLSLANPRPDGSPMPISLDRMDPALGSANWMIGRNNIHRSRI